MPPTTKLFPSKDERISIKQGSIGDCYLLAMLDNILNTEPLSRERFQESFTQQKDGSVELKLPRSQYSKNLMTESLATKGFQYIKTDEFDVFRIPAKILEEIDNNQKAAKSNSLAVKIMEHLIPYYFDTYWSKYSEVDSLTAHSDDDVQAKIPNSDIANNFNRSCSDNSSTFVSKVLGLNISSPVIAQDIITTKIANQNAPVYINLKWGETDEYGQYHGRHAVRLEKIEMSSDGKHNFIFVNPWHNDKSETFDIEQLKTRDALFSTLDLDSYMPCNYQLEHDGTKYAESANFKDISIFINETIDKAIGSSSNNVVINNILTYLESGDLEQLSEIPKLKDLVENLTKQYSNKDDKLAVLKVIILTKISQIKKFDREILEPLKNKLQHVEYLLKSNHAGECLFESALQDPTVLESFLNTLSKEELINILKNKSSKFENIFISALMYPKSLHMISELLDTKDIESILDPLNTTLFEELVRIREDGKPLELEYGDSSLICNCATNASCLQTYLKMLPTVDKAIEAIVSNGDKFEITVFEYALDSPISIETIINIIGKDKLPDLLQHQTPSIGENLFNSIPPNSELIETICKNLSMENLIGFLKDNQDRKGGINGFIRYPKALKKISEFLSKQEMNDVLESAKENIFNIVSTTGLNKNYFHRNIDNGDISGSVSISKIFN